MAEPLKVRKSFLLILMVCVACVIAIHKFGVRISRSFSYEYGPVAQFNAFGQFRKCLPGGKIAFQIAYVIYHPTHWLAKFPDGGIPWYVAQGSKSYLYEPAKGLKVIPEDQLRSLAEATPKPYCDVELKKEFLFPGDNVRGSEKFLTIVDEREFQKVENGHIVFNYFSFDQLSLPDPSDYRGYSREDESAEALNQAHRR